MVKSDELDIWRDHAVRLHFEEDLRCISVQTIKSIPAARPGAVWSYLEKGRCSGPGTPSKYRVLGGLTEQKWCASQHGRTPSMQNRCLIQLYRRGRNGTELSGVFQKLADVPFLFRGRSVQMTVHVILEQIPKTGRKVLDSPARVRRIIKRYKRFRFVGQRMVRVYKITKFHEVSAFLGRGFRGCGGRDEIAQRHDLAAPDHLEAV